jgi:hypothetical protein
VEDANNKLLVESLVFWVVKVPDAIVTATILCRSISPTRHSKEDIGQGLRKDLALGTVVGNTVDHLSCSRVNFHLVSCCYFLYLYLSLCLCLHRLGRIGCHVIGHRETVHLYPCLKVWEFPGLVLAVVFRVLVWSALVTAESL